MPYLFCLILLLISPFVGAQMSERFGPYELHYSFVNTTFLTPEVAAQYQITRGKRHGILMLSLRYHPDESPVTEPRAMRVQGTTSDLMRSDTLEFKEIKEGEAVYYIAPFKFINEEYRHFYLDFRAENSTTTYSHHLQHQMYIHE